MTIIRDKFDFDVGYLIKSPCKTCPTRHCFPKCIDQCDMLDKIQRLLAQGIASSNSYSALDSYAVFYHDWEHH